jgi:glycine cleavage system aminomethyltransferase T
MTRPAGDVHVGRLALRVAGLDEDAARALARLVAEGLAPGVLRPAGIAGLDSLRVEVEAAAGADTPDLLARRIVGEIGRVLARDRVAGGPDGEAVP